MLNHVAYESVVTPDLSEGAILNTAHPGFREDYLVLHCLLRRERPRHVIEIGTNMGKGTQIIANAAAGAKVYTLDLPPDNAVASRQHPQHWGGRVGASCDRPYIQLWGDSMTFDYRPYHPLDAWYIDGEHDYIHARKDSENAVESGARLIVWHDTDMPEVARGIADAFASVTNYDLFRVDGTRMTFALRK